MKHHLLLLAVMAMPYIFAQKRDLLSLGYSGWASRSYTELSYSHFNRDDFGWTATLGLGQLGERMYDGKTRDLFGHTYLPRYEDATYIYHNNRGLTFRYLIGTRWALDKRFWCDAGFFLQPEAYRHLVGYDRAVYNAQNVLHDTVQITSTSVQLNMSIGFSVNGNIQLSKEVCLKFGFDLPFHLFNNDESDIGELYDPPMLGLEPVVTCGIRCAVKR